MKSNRGKKNWSLNSLVGVEQVPPRLAIAFEGTTPVDVDILTAKQEEASSVLEIKLEGVFLPETGVVRECDIALDVHVYVRQVAQI